MQTLKELIDLGFTPAVAAVMVICMVLWASVVAMVVAFHKENLRQRKINVQRIDKAERENKICEMDRRKLGRQMIGVQSQIRILHACPTNPCPIKELLKSAEENEDR